MAICSNKDIKFFTSGDLHALTSFNLYRINVTRQASRGEIQNAFFILEPKPFPPPFQRS